MLPHFECKFLSAAGGLTEADISALSQPIPDKFWSKMGRKMSTQRQGRAAIPTYRSNVENWFHEDDGTVPSTGLSPTPPPKKSFEEQASLSQQLSRSESSPGKTIKTWIKAWSGSRFVNIDWRTTSKQSV